MRRLAAIFLAICTLLSISTVASAAGESSFESINEFIDSWIDSLYQGDAEVSRVVTLYDANNGDCQNIGHLITFERNGLPAGYLILSHKEEGNPVFEFALEGESIYDYLEARYADFETNVLCAYQEKSAKTEIPSYSMVNDVLYTDFYNYSLVIDAGEETLLFDQEDQINACPFSMGDGIVLPNGYEMYPTPAPVSTHTLSLTKINNSLLMEDFSSNNKNCGPTAAANIIKLYAENRLNNNSSPLYSLRKNNSDVSTYNRLATLGGYSESNGSNVIDMWHGIEKFVEEQGYTSTYHAPITEWSDFESAIINEQPIFLHTYPREGDFGHAQVVVGTKELVNGEKYLVIYLGKYYRQTIYLKFDSSIFLLFYGCIIDIS